MPSSKPVILAGSIKKKLALFRFQRDFESSRPDLQCPVLEDLAHRNQSVGVAKDAGE